MNKSKRNIMLFFIITGMIRVMFVIVPMGSIVLYKWVNSVANDTELIKN